MYACDMKTNYSNFIKVLFKSPRFLEKPSSQLRHSPINRPFYAQHSSVISRDASSSFKDWPY